MNVLFLHDEIDFYKRYLNYKNQNTKNSIAVNDSFLEIEEWINQCKSNSINVYFYTKNLDLKKIDFFIFEELPNFDNFEIKNIFNLNKKKILIQRENQKINKKYNNSDLFDKFDQIFTWDTKKLKKKNFQRFHKGINFTNIVNNKPYFLNKKFASMVAWNKIINYYETLYVERQKIIKWFNDKCPIDFDLYGYGWNKFYFKKPKLLRVFNRFEFITKILSPKLEVYQGQIDGSLQDKLNIIKNYKFHFVIENASLNGWITEKIFHAYLAGTVPIYLGAPDINDFVPSNSYINYMDFKDLDDLYKFLKNIDNLSYESYLESARNYLESDKKSAFEVHLNIGSIINYLLQNFKNN